MTVLTPPSVAKPSRDRWTPNSDRDPMLRAWGVLGLIGAAFIVMGGTDIALAWYPSAFGNPEWEFGAISATLNGVALPTLGVYLLLAYGLAGNRTAPKLAAGILSAALFAALIALAFVYLTVVPLALHAVAANALVSSGMKKAIVKAILLLFAYGSLFVVAAFAGLRGRPRSS
jgi:hypothetical protein